MSKLYFVYFSILKEIKLGQNNGSQEYKVSHADEIFSMYKFSKLMKGEKKRSKGKRFIFENI